MPAALGWLTPRRMILLGAVVAAVVVVIVLLWYFLIRSDAPPPASIEAAVESVRTDQQAHSSPTAGRHAATTGADRGPAAGRSVNRIDCAAGG